MGEKALSRTPLVGDTSSAIKQWRDGKLTAVFRWIYKSFRPSGFTKVFDQVDLQKFWTIVYRKLMVEKVWKYSFTVICGLPCGHKIFFKKECYWPWCVRSKPLLTFKRAHILYWGQMVRYQSTWKLLSRWKSKVEKNERERKRGNKKCTCLVTHA